MVKFVSYKRREKWKWNSCPILCDLMDYAEPFLKSKYFPTSDLMNNY